MSSMPDWVLLARTFAATGKDNFLRQAADACPEAEIRGFLRREDVAGNGFVPAGLAREVAERLESLGRSAEAAIVNILGSRLLALHADRPEEFDRETGEQVARICAWLVGLSHEHAFKECEARFAVALGINALKRNELDTAGSLLRRAAAI